MFTIAFIADEETIRNWLLEGIRRGATHCLIICDTWDYKDGFEDYPLYIMPGENARQIAMKFKPELRGIEFLKEVFNLSMDIDKQLNERPSMNF